MELQYRGLTLEIDVTHYVTGTPDRMYTSNGDPGEPGDPAEIEFEVIEVTIDCQDTLIESGVGPLDNNNEDLVEKVLESYQS